MKRILLSAATLMAAVGCADVAVDDTMEMTPAPSGKAMEIYAEVAAPMATRLAVDPELGQNISAEDWHFRWEETDKLGAWSDIATATKAITFGVDIPNYADESGAVAPFTGVLTEGTSQFRFVYPLNAAANTIAGSIYTGYECATQTVNTKYGVGLIPIGDKALMVSNLMDVIPETTNYAPQMELMNTFMQFRVDLKNGAADSKYKLVAVELGTADGSKTIPTTARIDLSKGIDEDGFMTATEGLLTLKIINPNELSTGENEYLKCMTLPFGVSIGEMMGIKFSYYEIVDGISTFKTASAIKIFDYSADYLRATHNGMVLDLDLSAGVVDETKVTNLWKGLGTSTDPYLIENEADLRRIGEYTTAAGDNYKGVTFLLTNDITLTSDWEPIGYEDNNGGVARTFAGYLNGGDHTIDNFNINGTGLEGDETGTKSQGHGFVSSLSANGKITNLTIKGGTVRGVTITGTFAGFSHGIISYCTNYCDVVGNDSSGGIVGYQDKKNIDHCKNYGDITATKLIAGGIVGNSTAANGVTNINYSENYGDISSATMVGGIVGKLESSRTQLASVDRAYNEGTITGTGLRSGGIAGWNRAVLKNCVNKGAVNGAKMTGGIAGDHCVNNGKGGPNINLINYADVTGTDMVGGIIGEARQTLKNVLNLGSVTATTGMGGAIVGKFQGGNAKIFNSYYTTEKLTAVTKTNQSPATNLVGYTAAEVLENAEAMAEAVNTTYADKAVCTFWTVGDDGLPTIDIYALIINNRNLGGVKNEPKTSGSTAYWRDVAYKSWGGGNGTEEYPYQISNANQMARLMIEVNDRGNDFDGTYFIIIGNPIGFGANLWERIGSPEKPFKGMIDFNDCSLKNLAYATGDQFITDIQDVIYAENPEVQFYGNLPTQDYLICDRW